MRPSKELQEEWNRKLKESGFVDMEVQGGWSLRNSNRFTRPSTFKKDMQAGVEYFRILRLAFYHSNLLELHRDIIERYMESGNLLEACEHNSKQREKLQKYLKRKVPKMLDFVVKYDQEDEYE